MCSGSELNNNPVTVRRRSIKFKSSRDIESIVDQCQHMLSAPLLVNDSTDFRIEEMPFGSFGAAGLLREGKADAIEAKAEKKMLIIKRAG